MKILDFDEEEFEEALEIGRDNTKEEGETMDLKNIKSNRY